MRSLLKPIVIIIALGAGFFASDLIKAISKQTQSVDLSQYCQLSTQSCDQKNASMSLSQDKTHPLVANKISVTWPNPEAKQLELTLKGVEMDMGVLKFVLKPASSGQFETDLILPVCTSESMTWAGELTDGETTVLPAIRMQR